MTRVRYAALSLALLSAAGCSDSVGPGADRPLSFSFTAARAGAARPALSRAPSFDLVVGDGTAEAVVIDTAQVVLREIELRGGNGCVAGDDDSDEDSDGCGALELGPALANLPLSAGVISPLTVDVPAGSYTRLEFELHRVSGDGRDSAFAAAHPEMRDASVRVTGTYRGARFVFTSRVDAEVELTFRPPLVVDGAASNATVNVDVASWFTTADGQVIAPTAENASRIGERIKASFRAFEDGDRDGDEEDSDSDD